MAAVILTPVKRAWVCPNCPHQHVTAEPRPHTPYHPCPGLAGVLSPMIPDGMKAKVTAHLREDYIGGEDVRLDEQNRPVMSVVTTRDDGEDCAVFAPTAYGSAHE